MADIIPTVRVTGFTAAMIISTTVALACFGAAPSECIEAAERAGLPDEVIEQLHNPEGLNAIERAALNRILSQAGIDDVCESALGAAGSGYGAGSSFPVSNRSEESSGQSAPETARDEDVEVQQTIAAQRSARVPEEDESRRRCQFWALNNLQPVVYAEFAKLDPGSMDDLDRILWRSILNPEDQLGHYDDEYADNNMVSPLLPRDPVMHCRDYWSEPLNSSNANLRNHGFESECRTDLERRITSEYNRLAEAASYRDDDDKELAYQIPNQYVRILDWLEISGDDLLDSGNPPYRILQEQSKHSYAFYQDSIPTEESLEEYRRETGTPVNLGWLGILGAAGMGGSSCTYYYPQMFYGFWVPFDPDHMPYTSREDEADLVQYDALTTPLYLHEKVSAERVRAGYPLGQAPDRYYLCKDSSDAEEVGYYYVDHPAGDYCERIQ